MPQGAGPAGGHPPRRRARTAGALWDPDIRSPSSWPEASPQPLTSDLNRSAGQTTENLAVAEVSSHGALSFYNGSSATVQLVIDACARAHQPRPSPQARAGRGTGSGLRAVLAGRARGVRRPFRRMWRAAPSLCAGDFLRGDSSRRRAAPVRSETRSESRPRSWWPLPTMSGIRLAPGCWTMSVAAGGQTVGDTHTGGRVAEHLTWMRGWLRLGQPRPLRRLRGELLPGVPDPPL